MAHRTKFAPPHNRPGDGHYGDVESGEKIPGSEKSQWQPGDVTQNNQGGVDAYTPPTITQNLPTDVVYPTPDALYKALWTMWGGNNPVTGERLDAHLSSTQKREMTDRDKHYLIAPYVRIREATGFVTENGQLKEATGVSWSINPDIYRPGWSPTPGSSTATLRDSPDIEGKSELLIDGVFKQLIDTPGPMTSKDIEVIKIPSSNNRITVLLQNKKTGERLGQYTYTDTEVGQDYATSWDGAMKMAADAKIPKERRDVQVRVVDGQMRYYPTISAAEPDSDFTIGQPVHIPGFGYYQEVAPGRWAKAEPDTPPFQARVEMIDGVPFIRSGEGGSQLKQVDPTFTPGVMQVGDQTYSISGSGAVSGPTFDPGVISTDIPALNLIQDAAGRQTPVISDIDNIITQALIDGDYDKAMAFTDFKERPTAVEAFNYALAYARSPADHALISAIARGETVVGQTEPAPGDLRRVGPQPSYLTDAYLRMQESMTLGRSPTKEEQDLYRERHLRGQSPYSDEQDATIADLTKELSDAESAYKLDLTKRDTQIADLKTSLSSIKTQIAEAKTAEAEAAAAEVQFTAFPDAVQTGSGATVANGVNTQLGFGSNRTGSVLGVENILRLYDTMTKQGWTHDRIAAHIQEEVNQGDFAWDARLEQLGINKPDFTMSGASGQPGVLGETPMPGGSTPDQFDLQQTVNALTTGVDISGNRLFTDAEVEGLIGQLGTDAVQMRGAVNERLRFRNQRIADQERERDPVQEVVETAPPVTNNEIISSEYPTTVDHTARTFHEVSPSPTFGNPQDLEQFTEQEEDFGYGYFTDDFADGGVTSGTNLELVGEEGPELVDLPPGSFVLPLKQLNQKEMRDIQRTGRVRGYANGGIVFDDTSSLPLGIRQLQTGRPITPSRGYLSQRAGLRLPSAQAFQNITPESREVFLDLAAQAGIPRGSFAQELALTTPGGRRLPTSRLLPISRRGVQ